MKLYDDSRAPNPRRVRIFLSEKGIEVERIDVSIAAKANLEDPYLGKNPIGLLPTLELDDGRLLPESIAICRYLEELHPEPNLFGVDAWERANVERWNRHAELEILLNVAQAFQNTSPFWIGRREQVQAFGGLAIDQLRKRMTWFDAVLEGKTFLVSDRLTVADITLFAALDFAKVVKVRVDESTPNLLRHYRAMSERPSAKA